jgi:release factor glutamine methyltransferase
LNLKLWVNESVLIPRPETEELVMHLSEYFKKAKKTPLQIIDLGTGSGCIALSLKKLYPKAKIIATDISESTLTTARYNSNKNQSHIQFFNHDMLKEENLPIESTFDAIVSNPPYVLKEESEFMSLHVLDHEPHIALFAQQSQPLAYYHQLKDYVIRYLQPGGYFIFEINESLGQETKEIFSYQNEHITEISLLKDAFGKYRFISGIKT